MKVLAVIVTFNRLELLKKCITAVSEQSRQPDDIIIINNGSTDDTLNWLNEQSIMYFTQPNTGGAGGFNTDIKLAYQHGADWVWVMDDDTIQQINALETLVDKLSKLGADQHLVGFLSSMALWTDGNAHQMNLTYPLTDKNALKSLLITHKHILSLIQFGTFVSMLISAKTITEIGLPIKEYFIWNDDVEYAKRIIAGGLAGIAVKESVVYHETPFNHNSNVFDDSTANLWKYRYGRRNELFTKRLHKGNVQFWLSWLHRMLIMPFRIAINRKDHRWAFIKMIWHTSIATISFNPVIEFVKSTETVSAYEEEK